MEKRREFGELEQAILQIIWERNEATVKEVHEALGSGNAYTTVMTVINRLYEKKQLAREKRGRGYTYWLRKRKTTPSKSLLERFKEKFFKGNSLEMVSYLIETSDDITGKELAAIEELIQKAKDKHHGAGDE